MKKLVSILYGMFFVVSLIAEETPNVTEEKKVETIHTLKLGGKELRYKATAGQIHLKDDNGKVKATFFYVGYTKEGLKDPSTRPITFCFNGGPGSSSVWLHMGAFGPKRIVLDDLGRPVAPYRTEENEYTLLDQTDLVFIDPVSTGYSAAAKSEEAKQFHGFDEDVKSVGELIRTYVTRHDRWTSPKFLIGVSYGTTRAAGLADHLHENANMDFNGLVLISLALDFQTLMFHAGNDLPCITFLPTYAAAAWYHQKISHKEYPTLEPLLKEVETFAYGPYASALLKGSKISKQEEQEILKKLSLYTGLDEIYIQRSNFRIPALRFTKELLRNSEKTIGRFDSRIVGLDCDPLAQHMDYDPSFEALFGPFTSVLNHYLYSDLGWKEDQEYKILTNVHPWDCGKEGKYLNVATDLKEVMCKNPNLKVFVANGQYDLATPYVTAQYTLEHMDLNPEIQDHITLHLYPAGHTLYLDKSSMVQFRQDLARFYKESP